MKQLSAGAQGWVRLGLLALVVVLLAQTTAHAIAFLVSDTYDSRVDLNASNSLPDLVSTAALVAAVLGAAMVARSHVARAAEAWTLATLLGLTVVADVVHAGAESLSVAGAVIVLGLGVAAVLIWRLARTSSPQTARLLDAALVCLIGSLAVSFVFHRVDGWLAVSRGDVVYEVKVILKQGLELAGWWLLALGLWSLAFPDERRALALEERPLPTSG
jgi:TRAP-type mannitol/chloroaromatic compound transport system permease large subunit